MKIAIFTGVALAALLAGSAPAEAAIVYKSYDFTATAGGPIASHSGSFSFSYDDVTFAPVLNSIDFAIGDTVFTTANTGIVYFDDDFVIGGTITGVTSLETYTDDFALKFGVSGNLAHLFLYTNSAPGFNFGLPSLTPSAVPEPSTWAMMILGIGGVGAVLRRRRRTAPIPV